MFSAEDTNEVFQFLSSEENLKNTLLLTSSGDGFVTRQHVYRAFEDLVTNVYAAQRVNVTSLARDLDVDVETVLALANEHDGTLILRGGNSREIITKAQRDEIDQEFEAAIKDSVVSKTEFARKHDLLQRSLEDLINLSKTQIVEVEGHLYSTSYDEAVSSAVASSLRDHLDKVQAVDFNPTNITGSPPTWFVHRTVSSLVKEPEFVGKFYVHEQSAGVRCTPVQLVKQTHDNVISNLQSGKIAYLDLQTFQNDNETIYPSVEEVRRQLDSIQGAEVVASFAISEAWVSNFSKDCLQGICRDDGIEIGSILSAEFPDSLQTSVLDRVEKTMQANSPGVRRVGSTILSELGYSRESNALLDLAKSDANTQWRLLKENPKADVRFLAATIASQVPANRPVMQDLIKERTVERALDDAFSDEILELEKQNEVDFAEFWTDRVVTRVAIYTEGLAAVEDQKLQNQLSDLLAQYLQKDLVPDAVSKATSQGLLLSRKTRKNVQKFESSLSADSMDVPAITACLEKLSKKQSVNTPAPLAMETSKTTMLNDMARRMQKQKKSDGPLLFLTLVVFLFAKHNAGVVYATGKFAPKLLKQLKIVLDVEQYTQLETWKESAKAGTLSAEDRVAMKKMVEAQV